MSNEPPKKLMETSDIVHFWEVMVRDRRLLSISTATFLDQTIKKLKELVAIERSEG